MRRLKRAMSALMAILLLNNTISFAEVMDISTEAKSSLMFLKGYMAYGTPPTQPAIYSRDPSRSDVPYTSHKTANAYGGADEIHLEDVRNIDNLLVYSYFANSLGPNLEKMILHHFSRHDSYNGYPFKQEFYKPRTIRLKEPKDLEILRELPVSVTNLPLRIDDGFDNFTEISEILGRKSIKYLYVSVSRDFDFSGLGDLNSIELLDIGTSGSYKYKVRNLMSELARLSNLKAVNITGSSTLEDDHVKVGEIRKSNANLKAFFTGYVDQALKPSTMWSLTTKVEPLNGGRYIIKDTSDTISGQGGYKVKSFNNVTSSVDGGWILDNPNSTGSLRYEPESAGELYIRNPFFNFSLTPKPEGYKDSIHKVENSWGQELTFDKFKLKSDYTTGRPSQDYKILSVDWNGHTLTSEAPTAPGLIKGAEQEVTTEGIATVKPISGANFNVPVQITYSDSLNAIYDGEVEPQTYTRGLEPFDQETVTFTKPLPSGTTVTVIDPPDTSSYDGNIGETRIEIVEVVTTFRDSSSKVFEMPVTITPSIADTFMKNYNESEFEIDIQQNSLLKKSDLYKKAETIIGQIPENITILQQPDSSITGSHRVPVIFSGFTDGSEYKGDITIYVRDEVPPVITAPATLPKGISKIMISTDEDSSYTIHMKKGILNSIIEVGGGQLVANTPTKVEVDTELLANHNALIITAKDEYDNESTHTISLQDADDFFGNEITVEVDGGGNLLDPDNPNIGDDGQIDSMQMFTISDKYPNKSDEIQSRLDYIKDRVQVNNTGSTTVNVSHQGLANITNNQEGGYNISYNIAISADDFEYKTTIIAPVELKNPAPIQTNPIKTYMTKLKGTGQPGATLNIFLHNGGIPTQTTTINEDGNWMFEGLDLHESTELTLTQEKQFEYGKSYDTTTQTVGYNSPPILTITNPTDQTINASGIITISGTVTDADNDKVTISATINGIAKSTTVNNTSTEQEWALSWTGTELAEGIANTITVQATD